MNIAQIQENVENASNRLTLEVGETRFSVEFTDVTKPLKSGARVFVPKKEFREIYGLTSSQANKLYSQTLNHFGRIEAQRLACQVLLDDQAIITKDGMNQKTNRRTVVFEPRKAEQSPKVAKASKVSKLEAENQALKARLEALEAKLAS